MPRVSSFWAAVEFGTLSGNLNALNSDMSKVYSNPRDHFRRSHCLREPPRCTCFGNALLQFWGSPSVGFGGRAFKGQLHTIRGRQHQPVADEANDPDPVRRAPDATLRRIAKMGDGWMMLEHAKGTEAETAFAEPPRYRARSAWKCGF